MLRRSRRCFIHSANYDDTAAYLSTTSPSWLPWGSSSLSLASHFLLPKSFFNCCQILFLPTVLPQEEVAVDKMVSSPLRCSPIVVLSSSPHPVPLGGCHSELGHWVDDFGLWFTSLEVKPRTPEWSCRAVAAAAATTGTLLRPALRAIVYAKGAPPLEAVADQHYLRCRLVSSLLFPTLSRNIVRIPQEQDFLQ